MKNLEISSMLLMIKRGYNIYSLNNETIIQMLSLGLIELVNEELVITEIGDLYLNKIMEEKSLLLLRYLSANNKALEISSMLLMIKRGYNIYSVNNETIIQMLSLGLIELVNEELVITEIGDLYLNKIMEEKSLLLLRYLSANNKAFDAIMANSLRNNESVKRVSL